MPHSNTNAKVLRALHAQASCLLRDFESATDQTQRMALALAYAAVMEEIRSVGKGLIEKPVSAAYLQDPDNDILVIVNGNGEMECRDDFYNDYMK